MNKQEKSPMKKYTVINLRDEFPNDVACLEYIKNKRWPDGIFCPHCDKVTEHYLIESRKRFSCQCGNHQVYALADTIFHKSSTSLVIWFEAIYMMAQTRGGVSAKAVERHTGVTYKTAWRMCKLIREALDEGKDLFGGGGEVVEVDETYYGAKTKEGKRGRGSENKMPIVGIVERGGKIHAHAIPDVKRATLEAAIASQVEKGAEVHTDEWVGYNQLTQRGYYHRRVTHGNEEYVRHTSTGAVHTNTCEGFWGNFKMGVKGTHHHVSLKYINHYLAEHSFRYNHRMDVQPMFLSMLEQVSQKR